MNSKNSLGILVALLVLLFMSLSGFLLIASANSVKHRDLIPKHIASKEELVIQPERMAEMDKMTEFQNAQEQASDKSEFNHLKGKTIINENNANSNSNLIADNKPSQANVSNNTSTTGGLKRTVIANYTIASGDSVSTVAKNYWGNPHLWPDLYVNNEWITKNPDLIYPLEKVRILNKLGRGGSYTNEEIDAINKAYLEVYNLYNNVGPRANPSKWYTLYSATQIIPDFFERNQGVISAQDIAMAKKQVKESQVFNE